jgi:hypothetical protein
MLLHFLEQLARLPLDGGLSPIFRDRPPMSDRLLAVKARAAQVALLLRRQVAAAELV